MTAVITVPATLDEYTFEQVLEQLAAHPEDAKLLVDARHTRFATPYGLTALLCLAQTRVEKPDFAPPEDDNVASYWARSAFYRYAEELYGIRGSVPRPRNTKDSDTVLEVTPIARSEDVHAVVDRVKDRATHILTTTLDLEPRSTMGFTMTLSEACQNIVEHAGRGGWVMVQRYDWSKRRAGRDVVQIAVCDAGQGFRKSLETSRTRALASRWTDGEALESGVMQGVSRFTDPGRGQGLKGIRGYVHRFNGKLSVRSGTSRIVASLPDWEQDVPRRDDLTPFAGAQLQIMIPKRVPAP
ncbi:MAG: ATP-binding protein [Gemmatimonadaceae bacterium]